VEIVVTVEIVVKVEIVDTSISGNHQGGRPPLF
jgi:hypothetical protein